MKGEACRSGVEPDGNRAIPGRAPMVGVGMVGSPLAIIRETRWGQAAFMAERPEEPPGGSQSVRSSEEAGNDRGAKGRRKVDATGGVAKPKPYDECRQRLSPADCVKHT